MVPKQCRICRTSRKPLNFDLMDSTVRLRNTGVNIGLKSRISKLCVWRVWVWVWVWVCWAVCWAVCCDVMCVCWAVCWDVCWDVLCVLMCYVCSVCVCAVAPQAKVPHSTWSTADTARGRCAGVGLTKKRRRKRRREKGPISLITSFFDTRQTTYSA